MYKIKIKRKDNGTVDTYLVSDHKNRPEGLELVTEMGPVIVDRELIAQVRISPAEEQYSATEGLQRIDG